MRQLKWLSLHEAVSSCLSSMAPPGVFVNEFQQRAFEKVGKKLRDPMYLTAVSLPHFVDGRCLDGCFAGDTIRT